MRNKLIDQNIKNCQPTTFGLVAMLLVFILMGTAACQSSAEKSKKKEAVVKTMTKEKNDGSVEYYDYEAQRHLDKVIQEMSAEASPYDFIIKLINSVEEYCWKALDVDTTYTPSWEKLGYLYSQVHGKQSMLRYNSYLKKGNKEKQKLEEDVVTLNFTKAELYYSKALEFGTDDSAGIYFQKAAAADILKNMSLVVVNMHKAVELEPDNRLYETKLIESYMYAGMFDEAFRENENYRNKYPKSDVPYLNLGGYNYFSGDTLEAIKNYKIAIEKGTKPEVAMLLHKYYSTKGDTAMANFYLKKLDEMRATYIPDDY